MGVLYNPSLLDPAEPFPDGMVEGTLDNLWRHGLPQRAGGVQVAVQERRPGLQAGAFLRLPGCGSCWADPGGLPGQRAGVGESA